MLDSRDSPPTVSSSEGEILGDFCAGTSLGKYRLIRRLGRGGAGVVYEAIDPILDRAVAIKVLRDGIAAHPESVRKFLREARTAAKLNHPHVVHVYEADQEKGVVYLVMELMEGGSAHDRIRQWGPFPWDEAARVMLDACKGLAAVHAAGLIHRDVKPSNVMRAADGKVKLADFGLAATFDQSTIRTIPKERVVGTPLYMSPEQCEGRNLDPRSDIYAMGAAFYHLLTGRPPFEGGSPMEIMQGHCTKSIPDPRRVDGRITPAVAELVCQMLAKDPARRPPNADEVIRTLEAILRPSPQSQDAPLEWKPVAPDASPTLAPIPGAMTTRVEAIEPIRPSQPPRRRTRLWLVAGCLLMTAAAFGIGRHFSSRKELPPPTEAPLRVIAHAPRDPGDVEYPGRFVIKAAGPVTSIAFHGSDYTQIAWGTEMGEQRITSWRTDDRPALKMGVLGAPACRQVAYWSARRSWALLADNKVHIVPADSGRGKSDRYLSVANCDLTAVALHPDLNVLAFAVAEKGDANKGGIVWGRPGADETAPNDAWLDNGRKPVQCVTFSRDGQYLLSGQSDGIVSGWKMSLKRPEQRPDSIASRRIGYGPVTAIAPLDDKRFAVAVGNLIRVCDASTMTGVGLGGQPAETRVHEGTGPITALASCPGEHLLACACDDGICVYSSQDGGLVRELKYDAAQVTALAFAADGKWLASGSADGKIVIWPLE